MSRRRAAVKRAIIPDFKYRSVLVSRFVNIIMKGGEKSIAERIVYSAISEASKVLRQDPLEVLSKSVENVRPMVEVKSRRVGGATYQVPVEVKPYRSVSLALKWIKTAFLSRGKGGAINNLKLELLDAYTGKGAAVKKRDDCYKMAESNKAFAHYRWSQ